MSFPIDAPTSVVVGPVVLPDGRIASGGRIYFKLSNWDFSAQTGLIVPEVVSFPIDDQGNFEATIFANSGGETGSFYQVSIGVRGSKGREESFDLLKLFAPVGGPHAITDFYSMPIDEPVAADVVAMAVSAQNAASNFADLAAESASSAIALMAMLGDYSISVEHNVIELDGGLDLRGENLNLSKVKYVATSGVPVIQVGGHVDAGTTISVSDSLVIEEGVRSFQYDSLNGPLAADDWIALKGRMKSAFTNNSGRNVFWGAMVQVRDVDTDTNTIELMQPISVEVDQISVTNGTYWGESGETLTPTAITVEKVIPRRVNLTDISIEGVFLVAKYVIDSKIHVYEPESTARCKTSVTYGTQTDAVVVSRARQPNGGDHALEVNFHNGGLVSLDSVSANYTYDGTTPAKGLRGNSITNATIRVRAISQAMQAATIQVAAHCKFDVLVSDTGTHILDAGTTGSNLLDAVKIEYPFQCTGSIVSNNAQSTAFELFGARQCNLKLSGWRNRPNTDAGDGGIVSIKGAGRGNHIDIFFRNNGTDISAPCVRYEMLGADENGVSQSDDTINLDVEVVYGQAFLSLGSAGGVLSANTTLTGRLKGPAPMQCFAGTTGFICKDLTLISTNTHAVQSPEGGLKFYGCLFDVPSGRRPISCYSNPDVEAKNCTGNGPIHLVAQDAADDAEFDITKFHGSDMAINFYESDSTLRIFKPHISGGWEVSGIDEDFNQTLSAQVLDLPIGVWSEGDILWNYHTTRGPNNWRWTGSYWLRYQVREVQGFAGFTTFGVAMGASKLTYAAADIELRDEVTVRLAHDAQGLTYQGMCNTDGTLTVQVQNNTGGVVTLPNSGWYWTARKHTTGQL